MEVWDDESSWKIGPEAENHYLEAVGKNSEEVAESLTKTAFKGSPKAGND